MRSRLHDMTGLGGRTFCRALIVSAIMLTGWVFGTDTDDKTANVETESIVKTVTTWLEPYQTKLGVTTERDGCTTYIRGTFGELQSVFNMFNVTIAIDSANRDVVCFAYLPTTVSMERRRKMVEFIFRSEREYGLSTASMVLDETGRIRCQAWSPFESFAFQPKETKWRLMGAVVDKLWAFSKGVAVVALGGEPAAAASDIKRISAFEGLDEAAYLKDAADVDTKVVLERCFDKDDEIMVDEACNKWLEKLSGRGGDVRVGMINARFEKVVRDVGGRYDVLPYSLIVREGVVWNVCNVPEECPDEMKSEMADILMKKNQGLKCALYGMDFDTGKIWCHYEIPVSIIPERNDNWHGNLYGVFMLTKTIVSVAGDSEELHSVMSRAKE